MPYSPKSPLVHTGWCPICEAEREFRCEYTWLRDHFVCTTCESVPRERALMAVIAEYRPNWRDLTIHESSPGGRGVSKKLSQEAPQYSYSHFLPGVDRGAIAPDSGIRCEDLERLTFDDESFDLIITQDVLEHVFDPRAVFREIERVLKPGGAHIFTVPIVNKSRESSRRAARAADGTVSHFKEPEFHGNPVDAKGALVTVDWGYDIAALIQQESGMATVIIQIDDIDRGIRAEFLDVVVSLKALPSIPNEDEKPRI